MKNAAVFIISGKKTLILCYNKYYKKGQWTGPGGKIEKGEYPKEAAKRELNEETGLVWKKLDKEEIISFKQDQTKIYVIKVKKLAPIVISKEHSDYDIVNIKDLKNYPLTNYFQKTVDYLKEKKII